MGYTFFNLEIEEPCYCNEKINHNWKCMHKENVSKSHISVLNQKEKWSASHCVGKKPFQNCIILTYSQYWLNVMMHFISGCVWKQELVQLCSSQELADSPLHTVPFRSKLFEANAPLPGNSSLYQQYLLIYSNLTSHWSYLVGSKFVFT